MTLKTMTLFENKKIRSAWDNGAQKRWFSAVDICAVLKDCDYQTARNYWKWLKHKLVYQKSSLTKTVRQLKFEAVDGRLRYTDVMDAEEILQLIQIFPSPKAEIFRQWIEELAAEGAAVVECLAEACSKAKDNVKRKVGGFMKTIIRLREFNLNIPADADNNDHFDDPFTDNDCRFTRAYSTPYLTSA